MKLMKNVGICVRFLLFVESIILSLFIVSPIIHESGHVIIGLWQGMKLVELKITVPLFAGENYVVMEGFYSTSFLFMIGGSFLDLVVGSIILLICKKKYSIILLGFGLGLQSEGVIYFFYSMITGYGDFACVDISVAVIYFIINIVVIIIMIQYIFQGKRGKKIIQEIDKDI